MATLTYVPLATQNMSGSSSITFSSIPTGYTDLRLVFSGIATIAGYNPLIRFNGDTGSNYSNTQMYANGSATSAQNYQNRTYCLIDAGGVDTSPNASVYINEIFSYTNSYRKTMLSYAAEDQNNGGAVSLTANLWRGTSAINSITIYLNSGTFSTNTVATLWGI